MPIIKLTIDEILNSAEYSEYIEAIGVDTYISQFNLIYNDPTLHAQLKDVLSEGMWETITDWNVIVFNGELSKKWLDTMGLPELPDVPIFTNLIGDEPYIYIDMTTVNALPDDLREVTVDYMLIKEGVHREQILRGDMVIYGDTLTWKGVTYTREQIHTMAHEKTEELLNSDTVEHKYEERDIVLLVDCQHEWERESTARTLASLSHVYEMTLTDTQRKLVDDWVCEFYETVLANTDDGETVLENPVLSFEVGTEVATIKEWIQTLFMCDVEQLN